MKRRITLVVDDDERAYMGGGPFPQSGWGITIESDEPVPEPDRVQEFCVRVVTRTTDRPFTANEVRTMIYLGPSPGRFEDITVTEVES